MSNAEKFIKEYTRKCSNELVAVESRDGKEVISYYEWLTPDEARKAVEIAREEMIEKACKFVREHFFFQEDREWMLEGDRELTKKDKAINHLKQTLKDEQY